MVSLKYAKEYRLDTFTDERGKVKDCTVYIGSLYEWSMPEEQRKRLRGRLTVMTIGQAVLFISSIWNYNDLSRLWWVMLPYACLLFVFLYLATVCYNLFTVKGQFHREQKDKTVDRMKACSVMGAILTGSSFLSATISLLAGLVHIQMWDVWFIITEAVLLTVFLYEAKLSKLLQVRELSNPKAQEWKDR